MTPADIARLLAACAAYDRRTVGEMDIIAWHKAIGALDYADSLEAVARHYANSRDWIMPADVAAGVRAIRNDRAGQIHSEALALPSKFEDDALRDLRLARGIAHCRDVLDPILDCLRAKRDASAPDLSESDRRLMLARKRAREIHRENDMAVRYGRAPRETL